MCSELLHDGVESGFVFLEQYAELLVFMKQRLVFDDELGIMALEFRFERFCRVVLRELTVSERKGAHLSKYQCYTS